MNLNFDHVQCYEDRLAARDQTSSRGSDSTLVDVLKSTNGERMLLALEEGFAVHQSHVLLAHFVDRLLVLLLELISLVSLDLRFNRLCQELSSPDFECSILALDSALAVA